MASEQLASDTSVVPFPLDDRLQRIRDAMKVIAQVDDSSEEHTLSDASGLPTAVKAQRINRALGVVSDNLMSLQLLPAEKTPVEQVMPLTDEQRQLAEKNFNLVGELARQIKKALPSHVDINDLIGAGTLGLLDAASKFDSTQGYAFTSFAAPRIRGAIMDSLRASDWVPRSIRQSLRHIDSARNDFVNLHGRQPTNQELAKRLERQTRKLQETSDAVALSTILSIDATIGTDDDNLILADTIIDTAKSAPEILEARELNSLVEDAIACLPDKLRQVVIAYNFEGRMLADIGLQLEVTESRACQIHTKAIALIRDIIMQMYIKGQLEESPTDLKSRQKQAYGHRVMERRNWKERISSESVS